jgi:hypothetical protein
MKFDFEDPDGFGWVCLFAVIGIAIVLIVGIVSDYHENSMKMALEAGCSQTVVPGTQSVYWSNCTKGLPQGK